MHLLQGKHPAKVKRDCQVGSEKYWHRNGLWFLRESKIPCFVQRLPGSWQHTHQAHFINGCFRQCSRAPESACFWSTYAKQWKQSCQTFIYRSWIKKSEWRKAGKNTENTASWQGHHKRDRNLWIQREWGHPHCLTGLRALPLLVLFHPLLHVGAAVCTEGTPVQEACAPQTPTHPRLTDVLTGQNGRKLRKKFII